MENRQRLVVQAVRGHWHVHPGGEAEVEALLDALELRPGQRLLDLGCGYGAAVELARRRGLRAFGLDLLAPQLHLARRRAALPLLRADALRLPFRDGSLDAVVALCVLGYVPDRRVLLAEARRVLRPGGRLGADLYTVLDPTRYRPRPGGMAHVTVLDAALRDFRAAGLRVLAVEDLTPCYREAYRAFLRDAGRARPELEARFGREAVEDALSAFERNVLQVLRGEKGGARVLARKPP